MAFPRRRPARKTKTMLRIEREFGEPLEVVLRRLYVEEGLTLDEIAKTFHVTQSTVWHWCVRFNIPRRVWVIMDESASAKEPSGL
jgi:hypothetical protein